MSKRTTFTSITPLPKNVTRTAAVSWLHNHVQMIRLNPLVIRLQETTPPPSAAADEYNCAWYEITDEISYLPGGLYKGEVTYKACFNDLPNGIQTHTFAPAGLDLRGKWTVGGNEPGEPRETLELGMDAPREGLYVREDVDMRCNIFLTGFVKKNLTKSHKSVVDKLANLGSGHEPGDDGHPTQGHGHDGPSDSSVPTPWHNNEQTLTPVDSNTMFSPDSYLRDSAQRPQSMLPQHEDLSYADSNSSVGHQLSPHRENSRSHLHSHVYNPRASPARLAPKLSYREHERIRDIAPQLPPLDFLQSDSPRDPYSLAMPYERTTPTEQQLSTNPVPPHREHRGEQQTINSPPDPSMQAEFSAQGLPRDEPNDRSQDDRGGHPAPTNASGLLEPGTHATTQRLSTDFTWRPGSHHGAST